MKTKTFNLLKSSLSLKFTALLVLLLMFNCQNDDLIKSESQNIIEDSGKKHLPNGMILEEISRENIDNPDVISILNRLKNSKKVKVQSKNSSNKTITNDSLHISISDSHINYVESEDGSYHSYTFPAFDHEHPEGMKNLLISLQPDGNYKEMIISYDLSDTERELLNSGSNIDIGNKISYHPLEDNTFSSELFSKIYYNAAQCMTYSYAPITCCGTENHTYAQVQDGAHCPWTGDCAPADGYFLVLNFGACDDGGNDNGSDTEDTNNNNDNNPPPPNDTTNSPSGPNGGSIGGNADVSIPTDYTEEEIIALKLKTLLGISDPDLIRWLEFKQNSNKFRDIYDELNNNGCLAMQSNGISSRCQRMLEQAKMSLLVRFVDDNNSQNWDETNSGNYNNNIALAFDATYNVPNSDGGGIMYRLINHNQVLFATDTPRVINPIDGSSVGSTEIPLDGAFHYIFNNEDNEWYEFGLPTNNSIDCLSCTLNDFFESFLENTIVITGRYFLPVEDVIILFTGEDFYGVESSQAVAGGFILVELIPGAAAIKAIKMIKYGDEVIQAAEVVIKYADNVYKAQKELVQNVFNGIESLTNNTRRGNFGEIVVDIDIYERGYEFINRTDGVVSLNDTAIHSNGIDHIIKNPRTDEYVLIETKYNGATLNPITNYGAQMSDTWILHHLNNQGIDPSIAQDILLNGYTSVLGHVAPDGTITYTLLNDAGIKLTGPGSSWTP